jgi:hypothetical protein
MGPATTLPAPTGPDPAVQARLARLRRLLQDGDTEAIDLWRDEAPALSTLVPALAASRISAALQDYDFEAALRWLPGADTQTESSPMPSA